MSRSPAAESISAEYDQAWQAINELIREDGSWSGRERNNFHLNLGDGRFVEASGALGLDFPEDGRAVAVWDFDRDGDLDLLLKNRNGPQLRLLRNESERSRHIAFRLTGRQSNRDAVGARVRIRVGESWRSATVTSGDGFLSQSSRTVTFGLGDAELVSEVEVTWPGGARQVFATAGLEAGRTFMVRESEPELTSEPFLRSEPDPTPAPLPDPAVDRGHSWLALPTPAPAFNLVDLDGNLAGLDDIGSGFRLVNFWATWCGPCRGELREWASHYDRLKAAGVGILAVSVDDAADRDQVETFRTQLQLPFAVAHADTAMIRRYNIFYRSLFTRRSDMQIPTTLLIDPEGRLRKVYRGVTPPELVLEDVRRAAEIGVGLPFDGTALGFTPFRDEFSLGTRYLQEGFTNDAISVFERVVQTSPSEVEAWGNLGAAYLESGRLAQASGALGRALELDPDYLEARLNLGHVEVARNRPAEALANFETAAALAPDQAQAQIQLALLLARQGRVDDAIRTTEAYLDRQPGDAQAHNSLGIFLAQAGLLDRALEVFSRAVELDPNLGEAHLNRGRAQLEAGNPDAAVASLETAANLLAEQPPVHYHLARALLAAGRREEARAALERVLQLDPASIEARRLLAEISPELKKERR